MLVPKPRRRKKAPFRLVLEILEGRLPPGSLFGGGALGWWGAGQFLPSHAEVMISSDIEPDAPSDGNLLISRDSYSPPQKPDASAEVAADSQATADPSGGTADRASLDDATANDAASADQLTDSSVAARVASAGVESGGSAPVASTSSAGGAAEAAPASPGGVAPEVSTLTPATFHDNLPPEGRQALPSHPTPEAAPSGRDTANAKVSLAGLPLSFETAADPSDGRGQFIARGPGYNLSLNTTEAVLDLQQRTAPAAGTTAGVSAEVRMDVVGGNPDARGTGADPLPGRVNDYAGNDPGRWRTGVATFGRVEFQGVYPGIDLTYYGNQRQLEYDFTVAPGADPNAIALSFPGTDRLEISPQGDLVLHTGDTAVVQHRPFVYQEGNGVRQEVPSRFILSDASSLGTSRVGFRLGAYDATRPLVIDPQIVYSSFLGGSGVDEARGLAVDPNNGLAFITGFTTSADFPTVNPSQAGLSGGSDAFVAAFNYFSDTWLYVTYLGGSSSEEGNAVAADTFYGTGTAWVTGLTRSADFPTTAGALQTTFGGGADDAFATELNADGTLAYSTYLGGAGSDEAQGIAIDSGFNASVVGFTTSANFPTTPGAAQGAYGGNGDVFVTKLDPALSTAVFSTYLGGSADEIGFGVAVDANTHVFLTGYTSSANFPTTAGAFQASLARLTDAFVTHLDPAGNLIYSTYLGGQGSDEGLAIAVDTYYGTGTAWVVGETSSTDLPVASAFQPTYGGGEGDAFVASFDYFGNLSFATYLGGSGLDDGMGVAIDYNFNVYVTGSTDSQDFPVLNAVQPAFGGGDGDAYVTKLDVFGNLISSTYLGGGADDGGLALATDNYGDVLLVGQTGSADFPRVAPLQPNYGGGLSDGFLTVFYDGF